MAGSDREGEEGADGRASRSEREAGDLSDEPVAPVAPLPEHPLPDQSPLFHAEQADRYARQELIGEYQDAFGCRLIAMVDLIFPYSVTLFEELIYDADPDEDLHLLLFTPGGDGETAVRLVRSAQARCKELTIIVPDLAKSAGTILAMGAHHILMAPTSDLDA